ncbi:MAG: MotA/TolQ/ExbB proton channel family protein [Candidatus Methylacidiphilales bacterium]
MDILSLAWLERSVFAAGQTFVPGIQWSQEIAKGGWVMVTLGIMSVLGLAVAFERLFHLRAKNIAPKALITAVLQQQSASAIEKLCADHPSTLATVLRSLLDARRSGTSRADADREAGDLAAIDLKRHLQKCYPLAIVATLAPLLGLLGTVIGMIESFHIIGATGNLSNPSLLAGSIAKALITTAGGLCVAIPALGLYHWFKSRLASYAVAIDEAGNRFSTGGGRAT